MSLGVYVLGGMCPGGNCPGVSDCGVYVLGVNVRGVYVLGFCPVAPSVTSLKSRIHASFYITTQSKQTFRVLSIEGWFTN